MTFAEMANQACAALNQTRNMGGQIADTYPFIVLVVGRKTAPGNEVCYLGKLKGQVLGIERRGKQYAVTVGAPAKPLLAYLEKLGAIRVVDEESEAA